MLIMAIPLSLVCPVVILKYDLRRYVNTFMGRGQTSVGKYNPASFCLRSYLYLKNHPTRIRRLARMGSWQSGVFHFVRANCLYGGVFIPPGRDLASAWVGSRVVG